MIETLMQNELVTGLGAASIIAGLMVWMRQVPAMLFAMLERQATVTLTIRNDDPAFYWISKWMAELPYTARARRVALSSVDGGGGPSSNEDVEWFVSIGPGFHWFRHNGRWIMVSRQSEEPASGGTSRQVRESFEIKVLSRSQNAVRGLIDEARDMALGGDRITIRIWQEYWRLVAQKRNRDLSTVVLPDGQLERIVADLHHFAANERWYREKGIPYRRGYLFSGPPGTGKTTLIMALAAEVKRPLCVLNVSNVRDDNALINALTQAPHNAIIALEDIDCAEQAGNRKKSENDAAIDESFGGITRAGLLNALDGIATPEGRITIMTSNYPEKLDAALIRPGRADIHEHFGFLEGEEQRRMAERFYGNAVGPMLDAPISPAELQGAFMQHPDNLGRAMEQLRFRSAAE